MSITLNTSHAGWSQQKFHTILSFLQTFFSERIKLVNDFLLYHLSHAQLKRHQAPPKICDIALLAVSMPNITYYWYMCRRWQIFSAVSSDEALFNADRDAWWLPTGLSDYILVQLTLGSSAWEIGLRRCYYGNDPANSSMNFSWTLNSTPPLVKQLLCKSNWRLLPSNWLQDWLCLLVPTSFTVKSLHECHFIPIPDAVISDFLEVISQLLSLKAQVIAPPHIPPANFHLAFLSCLL